jgi:hypothetical protein
LAKHTILSDNLGQYTGKITDTTPEGKGNLKNDEDYESGEKGDPWDKFAFNEINDQYYAVAVGRNENSFGIYADMRKFKDFRQACMNRVSHMIKLTNIWNNIYTKKRGTKRWK